MRTTTRRQVLAALTATAALLSASPTFAAPYPDRPIRIVVPWPAGGLVDIVARNLGNKLNASLGQPVVIENKPGAGGSIGADAVAKAPADGYSLLVTTSALNMNAALGTKTPFDVQNDLDPIAVAAFAPNILVVHPSLPVQSVADLVALLQKSPGRLTYASAGTGSPAHMSAELFKSMAGVDAVHVPYKGAPAAMIDQIAGRIDFHFANAAVALPQVQAGKVRALAVTSARRSAVLPSLPTMAEAGMTGFEADQWIGVLAPAGTPTDVATRLAAEVNKALAADDVQAALAKSGMIVDGTSTPASFRSYVQQDLEKWSRLVKKANIKSD